MCRNILYNEAEILLKKRSAFIYLGIIPCHDDHLINGLSVILIHGADAEVLAQSFPPALYFGITSLGTVKKILKVGIAERSVFSFDGAKHTVFME